jgi:predicted nucleic acid-binding protein
LRVLVDTSVWIDLINEHDSAQARALADLLAGEDDVCTCGVIFAEVLQGLRRQSSYDRVRGGFADLTLLEPQGLREYERAAALYRELRGRGVRVRSTIDCLIAALAERHRCLLLHRDRDLDAIAGSGLVDLPVWPG